MLKLYGWTDQFEKTIEDKRKAEMGILWTRFNLGMINIALLYFFPQILGNVVFTAYIGTGH
jgi:hypothetical protein